MKTRVCAKIAPIGIPAYVGCAFVCCEAEEFALIAINEIHYLINIEYSLISLEWNLILKSGKKKVTIETVLEKRGLIVVNF